MLASLYACIPLTVHTSLIPSPLGEIKLGMLSMATSCLAIIHPPDLTQTVYTSPGNKLPNTLLLCQNIPSMEYSNGPSPPLVAPMVTLLPLMSILVITGVAGKVTVRVLTSLAHPNRLWATTVYVPTSDMVIVGPSTVVPSLSVHWKNASGSLLIAVASNSSPGQSVLDSGISMPGNGCLNNSISTMAGQASSISSLTNTDDWLAEGLKFSGPMIILVSSWALLRLL